MPIEWTYPERSDWLERMGSKLFVASLVAVLSAVVGVVVVETDGNMFPAAACIVGSQGAGVSGDPLCDGPPDHPDQRAGAHPHLGLHRRHLLQGISGYRPAGFNGILHGRPSDADEPRRPCLCPEPCRASLCP